MRKSVSPVGLPMPALLAALVVANVAACGRTSADRGRAGLRHADASAPAKDAESPDAGFETSGHEGGRSLRDGSSGIDAGSKRPTSDGAAGTADASADAAGTADASADAAPPDTTPPVFDGNVTVVEAPRAFQLDDWFLYRLSDVTYARITWAPATDDVTLPADLVYEVLAGKAPGAEDAAHPLARSAPGATTLDVGPLDSNASYYFVVRVVDAAGNATVSTDEGSLQTLVSFENDVQPILTRVCAIVGCHGTQDGNPPHQNLNLEAGAAYGNLVDRTSREGTIFGRPTLKLVDTTSRNPDDSFLWSKLGPDSWGSQLPPPGFTPEQLSPLDVDVLKTWILQATPRLPSPCWDPGGPNPMHALCPTAAQPVQNGDFESGDDAWVGWSGTPGPLVVTEGSGNHALRFRIDQVPPPDPPFFRSRYVVTYVIPPATPSSLRFRYRGEQGHASLGAFLSDRDQSLASVDLDVMPDGPYLDAKICLVGSPEAVQKLAFTVFTPIDVTANVLIDDVTITPDPSCSP